MFIPPDLSGTLAGQQFVPAYTGFSGAGASDPSGINGSDPTLDPTTDPNPTGGWQQALLEIGLLASQAFQTYERGTPQVATPPAAKPTTSIGAPSFAGSSAFSSFNLSTLLIAGAGVVLLVVLVKVA